MTDVTAEARRTLVFAHREAQTVLADARAAAATLRQEQEQAGYAAGLERGRQEGHAAGREQGLREAREAFASESQELADLLRRMVGEFEAARREVTEAARVELLDLAVALAEKIVGPMAVFDPQAARVNLAKVLEMHGSGGDATIRVHPEQLAMLREFCGRLTAGGRLAGTVELVGDERVSRGGAVLETLRGQIDASIETQLNNVVSAVVGPRRTRSDQADTGEAHGPV